MLVRVAYYASSIAFFGEIMLKLCSFFSKLCPFFKIKKLQISLKNTFFNRPRSIYQYPNMAPRLSGQTSIFGFVFFVSKSLLGIEGQ